MDNQVIQIDSGTTTSVWMNGELVLDSTDGDWGTPDTFWIGTYGSDADATTRYAFEGYMADVYCIDGQALQPTSFGTFNDDGVWVPINYTGTYGDNGFHLDFSDPSDIGEDSSGNNNDFTATGFELTDTTDPD